MAPGLVMSYLPAGRHSHQPRSGQMRILPGFSCKNDYSRPRGRLRDVERVETPFTGHVVYRIGVDSSGTGKNLWLSKCFYVLLHDSCHKNTSVFFLMTLRQAKQK